MRTARAPPVGIVVFDRSHTWPHDELELLTARHDIEWIAVVERDMVQNGMIGTPPNCRCPPNSELLGGNCVRYTASTCSNALAADALPQACAGRRLRSLTRPVKRGAPARARREPG